MISVIEHWYLKPGLESRALELMQEMDDILGPNAHDHPGWAGHAHFYQSREDPLHLLMLYPWRSIEMHEDLARGEEPMLEEFYEKYCSRRREITYFEELPVEVEHDHDHEHGHGGHHHAHG